MQSIKIFTEKLPKLKRSQTLILGIIILLLFILFIYFIINSRFSESSTSQDERNIASYAYILDGGPKITYNEITPRTIQDGEELEEIATITTDSISKSLIILSDNSILLIDANSEVIITTNETSVNFEILKGDFFLRANKIDDHITSKVISVNGLQINQESSKTKISLNECK